GHALHRAASVAQRQGLTITGQTERGHAHRPFYEQLEQWRGVHPPRTRLGGWPSSLDPTTTEGAPLLAVFETGGLTHSLIRGRGKPHVWKTAKHGAPQVFLD